MHCLKEVDTNSQADLADSDWLFRCSQLEGSSKQRIKGEGPEKKCPTHSHTSLGLEALISCSKRNSDVTSKHFLDVGRLKIFISKKKDNLKAVINSRNLKLHKERKGNHRASLGSVVYNISIVTIRKTQNMNFKEKRERERMRDNYLGRMESGKLGV